MFAVLWRLVVARRRLMLVAVAATALVVVTAGCSNFVTPPTASQQNVIGDVTVASDVCLYGFGANSQPDSDSPEPATPDSVSTACTPPETSVNPSAGDEGQLLVGYLIPDGSTAPATLTSAEVSGVTFSQNSDYATWLTANETTPAGSYWVGYMSSDFTISDFTTAEAIEVDLDADFTLPQSSSGAPFAGPFNGEVVVGDRANSSIGDEGSPALSASRALDCSETVVDEGGYTDFPTGCDNDSGQISLSTDDLSVSAPASSVTAVAGTTATVPFAVQFAGTGSSAAAFALSATTNAAGATPSLSSSSLTPGGSGTTAESVSVPLPATLSPGNYQVTLTAADSTSSCTDATACTRSATATITVTAASTTVTPVATTPASTTVNTVVTKPALARSSILKVTFTERTLKIVYTLNVASSEKLTLERRANHRWLKLKTISKQVRSGRVTLLIKSLFAKRLLTKAGNYRLFIEATNHGLTAAEHTVPFTIR